MSPSPVPQGYTVEDTITIKAAGDLMMRRDLVGKGGETLWDLVGEDYFKGDLVMGNLEFAVNPDWNIEKLLRYSGPESYAWPLLRDDRFGKVDFVALANNHINDSLHGGICSTINFLDKHGIMHAGASRNTNEQDQIRIIECKGVRIAMLSYSFSHNGVPFEKGKEYGMNLVRFNALNDSDYDPSIIHRHIKLAKEQKADIIIANHHWGVEFEYYPPKRIVDRGHELLDAGVDIIIGHHPHILNPVERYKAKDGRECVVCYSLGNIVSWALKFAMQKMSEIAEIELQKCIDSDGKTRVRIGNVALLPTVHSMHHKRDFVEHRILPIRRMADAIRSGKRPEFINWNDKRVLLKLDKEYSRYFLQKGIEYR
jgi:poly-gamma-glutamate synthesis protein (capsule biosynthesis protein)